MLTQRAFYYLRHGQTDWNLADQAQGQTDIPLNQTGVQQAWAAVPALLTCPVTKIYASPLRRAWQTAQIMQQALNLPLEAIDDLQEANWGVMEGTPAGPWRAAWREGRDVAGAESFGTFSARALRGLNRALADPGPVLIVAHGGTYWSVERHAPFKAAWDIPNCTPLFHQPPALQDQPWQRQEVGTP